MNPKFRTNRAPRSRKSIYRLVLAALAVITFIEPAAAQEKKAKRPAATKRTLPTFATKVAFPNLSVRPAGGLCFPG